jgi:hypothetical protein
MVIKIDVDDDGEDDVVIHVPFLAVYAAQLKKGVCLIGALVVTYGIVSL